MSAATQTRYPWRTVTRTAFQGIVGLAPIVPFIVNASGAEATTLGVAAVTISSSVARIMANQAVEAWLQRFVPFLSAKPADEYQGKHEAYGLAHDA